MIIPKSLIDHLEHEINIDNVDKKVQNLILIILEENKQLKETINKAINFIKNHIQETTYKYVYSNEVNVIQELHLDNEELIELLEILERSDNN